MGHGGHDLRGSACSGRAGGLSIREMEREIDQEADQHARDGSERHGMVIDPVREDPCDSRSESTERQHEKEWSHRTTVAPVVRSGSRLSVAVAEIPPTSPAQVPELVDLAGVADPIRVRHEPDHLSVRRDALEGDLRAVG
jgi:hypothetical protein